MQGANPRHDVLCRLCEGKKIAKYFGADDDHDDHATGVCSVRQRFAQGGAIYLAFPQGQNESAKSAQA